MSRPQLIILHGWGADASLWQGVKPLLSDTFDVLTPELTGHGDSQITSTSLSGMAATLSQPITGPCTWLGWSLGALLAIQVALDFPARVSRLLLVSATPAFQQRGDWQTAMPESELTSFMQRFEQQPKQTLRRFYGLQTQGDAQAKVVLAQLKQATVNEQQIAWGLQELQQVDFRQQLSSVTAPVNLLHGEQDVVIPVEAGLWLAQQLHGQIDVLSQVGHAPMLSQPQAFTDWVKRAVV